MGVLKNKLVAEIKDFADKKELTRAPEHDVEV